MSRAPFFVLLLSAVAFAADVIPVPADKAKENAASADKQQPPPQDVPKRETVVRGSKELREEQPVGGYKQPGWSARRRFPNVRIYVAPEGTASFEAWMRSSHPLGDLSDSRYRTQYEFAFGLGHRLQLDLYVETEQRGSSNFEIKREKIELRWAIADWGVIPGNPTLYAELARNEGGDPPAGEFKLLLGGEISRGLHWGANLVFERELGGPDFANEYALTGGLSYTLIDEKLHVGGELQLVTEDSRGERFQFPESAILVGPSVLYRPTPHAQIAAVALIGPSIERDLAANETSVSALLQPSIILSWLF